LRKKLVRSSLRSPSDEKIKRIQIVLGDAANNGDRDTGLNGCTNTSLSSTKRSGRISEAIVELWAAIDADIDA
jgi:hypothetical protein